MKDPEVELIRRFEPIDPRIGGREFLDALPGGEPVRWNELEKARRVLILAPPGAGKTFEARERATKLRARGTRAFFIRIESIDEGFQNAFEVGTSEEFSEWL